MRSSIDTLTSKVFKLLLTLLLCLCSSIYLNAKTLNVCTDCEFTSIEAALDNVQMDDTIAIHAGQYFVENLVVECPIHIIGIDNPVIISKSGDEIFTIIENGVSIKGLTLKDVQKSYMKERSAIRVKRKKNFDISDNTIIDCFFGIYLEHAKNGSVHNNTMYGNATTEAESGNAIHAWYCDKLTIWNNHLEGHRDGIYFEFVNNSTIYQNTSQFNKRYGLHFMFSNDDNYYDNKFIENGAGVAVMFSRRIEMLNNIFSHNWGEASYGLLLKEIYDAEIHNNDFNNNTIGIFVEGSNRINYFNNNFRRNGWAIKFSGGCETNIISKNNFLYNSMDLVVNTKMNDNSFSGNYWSNYTGYDLDKDGIGDIAHYPVKLFSYIINEVPEAIVLMRSLFVDIINYTEKVSPVFTPKEVKDPVPLMHMITTNNN